jgi:hypothetical protein
MFHILVIREMQIKTLLKYHFELTKTGIKKTKRKITSVGKATEEIEPLCTVDGNVKWYSFHGKQCGSSSHS